MANTELNPDWWKKVAPKSVAGGAVQTALVEVAKRRGAAEKGLPADYFKALDGLNAAIARDEQKANQAKDKAAVVLLADLKKASVQGRDQLTKRWKHGGGGVSGI